MRNYEIAFKKAGFETKAGADSSADRWVFAHRARDDLYLTAYIRGEGDSADLTMVTPKAMEQSVTVDADAMLGELNKSGHVAVYGINFRCRKATLQPGSDATLSQIVRLLQDNPDLKLRVEGHTDNQNKAKGNLELSKKRRW